MHHPLALLLSAAPLLTSWRNAGFAHRTWRTPDQVLSIQLHGQHTCEILGRTFRQMVNLHTMHSWTRPHTHRVPPLIVTPAQQRSFVVTGWDGARMKMCWGGEACAEAPLGVLACVADGRHLITLSTNNSMMWTRLPERVTKHVPLPETCLCAALWQHNIFLGGLDGQLLVFDSRTVDRISNFTSPSPIRSLAVARPEGSVFAHVVMGCQDGTIRILRWFPSIHNTVLPVVPTAIRRDGHVQPLRHVYADAHRCISCCEDGRICVGNMTHTWFHLTLRERIVQLCANERFLVIAHPTYLTCLDFR